MVKDKSQQRKEQRRRAKTLYPCSCGCGQSYKDKETVQRHLRGIGIPSYLQLARAVRSNPASLQSGISAGGSQTISNTDGGSPSLQHEPIFDENPTDYSDFDASSSHPSPTAATPHVDRMGADQPTRLAMDFDLGEDGGADGGDRNDDGDSYSGHGTDVERLLQTIWPNRSRPAGLADVDSDEGGEPNEGELDDDADDSGSEPEGGEMYFDEEEDDLVEGRGKEGEVDPQHPEAVRAEAPTLGGVTSLSAWETLNVQFMRERVANASHLNESEMSSVRAFNIKVDAVLKDSQYSKLPKAFPSLSNLPSLFRLRKYIQDLSGVQSVPYDCCENSCICYTGPYETLEECPFCGSSRRDQHGKSKKQFHYLPLIPRLLGMYLNKAQSERMRYRSKYEHRDGFWRDIFDGNRYQSLLNKKVTIGEETIEYFYFAKDTDIALGICTDGVCPFKHRKETCWPLILFNYNLPPEIRFQLPHVIALGCIPGPRQMKDIDSFLLPFVEEMLKLARGVKAFDASTGDYFVLHAFLIILFGDIPAVAKLMAMKGVNAIFPCRMCLIIGIRSPDGKTYYVPLWRPDGNSIDPAALDYRTPEQFLRQAKAVQEAAGPAEHARLSKACGINGVPILSYLSSMEFPTSCPGDFMHIIYENLIPQLLDMWMGKYKGIDEGDEEYELAPTVLEAIGEATAQSGSTLPSSYGCRVPNFMIHQYHFSAEAWSIWTMVISPVLLRGRFRRIKYYLHFVKLVKLLNLCLQVEISAAELDEMEQGFQDWVVEFEQIYLQHNLDRLPLCTLPWHYLLHIAPSIRECGPVGIYWNFPMERYCGSLLPAVQSRKHPYRSIDRRIVELAQLSQIKAVYGLEEALDLRSQRNIEQTGTKITAYPKLVLTWPREHLTFSVPLRNRISCHLAFRLGREANQILPFIETQLECWGKLKVVGGEMMHAFDMVKNKKGRDKSYIRYTVLEDENRAYRNVPVHLVPKFTYGRLHRLVLVNLPQASTLVPQDTTYLLAIVKPCKVIIRNAIEGEYVQVFTKGEFLAEDVIDATSINSVAGRVLDPGRGEQVFVERPGTLTWMEPDPADDD